MHTYEEEVEDVHIMLLSTFAFTLLAVAVSLTPLSVMAFFCGWPVSRWAILRVQPWQKSPPNGIDYGAGVVVGRFSGIASCPLAHHLRGITPLRFYAKMVIITHKHIRGDPHVFYCSTTRQL